MLQSAGIPALAIIFMGFFGYYAVMGPNGVLRYREYTRTHAIREAEYARLDKKRAALRNQVALLDPKRGANPDMVDELVRRELNVAHPDEIIVPLN
ncbi:septum formation initiator family protein [Sphingomonas sp. IW22]|uniref:FtsB family cell division protein n=1 Tax=Sphingomonas sp. IW22 TaxID=3242489 RepID=UPI003520A6AD